MVTFQNDKKLNVRLLFFFLIMLALTLLSNIIIFTKRDQFNFIKQSSYYDLYSGSKDISINSFELIDDSILNLTLNNKILNNIDWVIKKDNQKFDLITPHPYLNLNYGVSNYLIKSPIFKDSLELKIEYFPDSYFIKKNSLQRNRVTIFRTPMPQSSIHSSIQKWKNNYIQINKTELESLKKVLLDLVHIKENDNSFIRAQKIARYLCFNISNSKGVPSSKTKNLSVYQQYMAALNLNEIDCGIYANIYSLFASNSNVINRIVEIKHTYGTFNENIHVFNEFYIEELQQWAATDIMMNNIYYENFDGKLLNGVEVKNTNSKNNCISVLQADFKYNSKDTIRTIPFSNLSDDFFNLYFIDKDLHYYYSTNLKDIYSVKEKAKRYFQEKVWFEIYSDVNIIDNRKFYFKKIVFYLFFIFLLLTVITFSVEKMNFYRKFFY